ncbi:MAG: T9SS type A sorting domain-containing protein [Bacteroidota bacterium]|nr:T9SS type A sorting domain-containing protein [Bacteroidota bacterium]
MLVSLLVLTGFSIFGQGITISDSIKSNNIFRRFRLYVPNSYTGQAVPLVFNLHGYTSSASQQQLYSNFMPIADTAKFLLVLPEGTAPSGQQYFNAGFGPGVNDVLFMSDLIDSLKLTYSIDNNCIYSCGMSNGGIMSYYLACNLPNRFAAIASVTGSMLNGWFTCIPGRPFPVMEIHGTNDATVPYNGDATFANIDSVVKKWRTYNNCNSIPITYSVPNTNTTDGATAISYRYTGGTNGAEVELYKVANGAHTWPGAFPIGVTCQDFNASAEIWRFFRKYKLNMFVTDVKENELHMMMELFPNPTSSSLNIKIECEKVVNYDITNLYGQQLLNGQLINGTNKIKTEELYEGIYFLKLTGDNNLTLTKKFIKSR